MQLRKFAHLPPGTQPEVNSQNIVGIVNTWHESKRVYQYHPKPLTHIYIYVCMFIYIFMYIWYPPPMDPGLVCLTFIFQCVMPCFAAWICVKMRGMPYSYTMCMPMQTDDKSNDISICNLKEIECIQECNNNSEILKNQLTIPRIKVRDSRI